MSTLEGFKKTHEFINDCEPNREVAEKITIKLLHDNYSHIEKECLEYLKEFNANRSENKIFERPVLNQMEWINGPLETNKCLRYDHAVLLLLNCGTVKVVGHMNKNSGYCDCCSSIIEVESIVAHSFIKLNNSKVEL